MFLNCCKSLGLVQPATITLGNGNTFQYVSVLDSLVRYFQQPDVLCTVYGCDRTITNADCDILETFIHGNFFLNHAYFLGNKCLLRLHLYCDELELCNPLGSSRTKHKVTAFYFYVGNVGLKHTSLLQNIFLALIVESRILKTHGYSVVLKPMIDDIKTLEVNGIVFQPNGSTNTVRLCGSLATISSDNLGAHDVAGFRKSFSTGRICRFCMCLHSELLLKHSENDFTPRTPDIHKLHVAAVENDSSLKPVYGVAKDCAFAVVAGFSAVESLPPDIMHDCLEGVILYFMQYFFVSVAATGACSISSMNCRIASFADDFSDLKNKPRCLPGDVINSSGKVYLSASESWCLFRLIPIIMSDVIKFFEDIWEIYVLLSEILESVFAPTIERFMLNHLSSLIEKFYSIFASRAPDYIKPKFHYLLRYPRLILQYGPLRHLW